MFRHGFRFRPWRLALPARRRRLRGGGLRLQLALYLGRAEPPQHRGLLHPQSAGDLRVPHPGRAPSPGPLPVLLFPGRNTAVVSFPNTGFSYNKALSGFSSIISSFTDSIPATAGTNAETSYDIWFSNMGAVDEGMIQNDYSPVRGPGCGSWTAANVQFGGNKGFRYTRGICA
jgi:hypothetical protein